MHKTHPDITDPRLRKLAATEWWVIRIAHLRAKKRDEIGFDRDWMRGIWLGVETFARRVQGAGILKDDTDTR